MNKYLLLVGSLSIFLFACIPPQKKNNGKGDIEFTDPTVQKILNYTLTQEEDSLITYFDSENITHKLLAINGFSSLQGAKNISKVAEKLKDADLDIKAAAAYVIGQIGDSSHVDLLIESFKGQDSLNIDNIFNHNVLEAIGKIGSSNEAEKIATVTTYRPTDSLLTLGQIRALYRFCARGIVPNQSIETSIKYLEDRRYKITVRQMAAQLLSRSKDIDLSLYADRLLNVLNKEKDIAIKISLTNALSKAKSESVKNKLIASALGNEDYRIRVNAIKSLSNYKEDLLVLDTLRPLITNPSVALAESYADLITSATGVGMFAKVSEIIPTVNHWLVRAKLLRSQMKNTSLGMANSKKLIQDNVANLIKQSTNEYEKAELIKVLGEDPYLYIELMNMPVNKPIEKVSRINALQSILDRQDFVAAYKGNYIKVKREIINFMATQMKNGEPEVVTQVASLLQKESNQAKVILTDSTLIDLTISKLKSPDDLEAIQEVKKLEAYLSSKEYKAPKPERYKPINFTFFEGKGDSIEITMKTDKGNIIMVLFPKIAPQTVSSFIDLCQKGYFNNKVFHRVVPNFVVQAGCPRGDGSGSLDFTLRTEVPQSYYDSEGSIGMASAGFHTESSQFFITHSATPHLDGKYTLFGKVIKGMDVVNEIGIGDKIIDTFVKK